MSALYNWFYYLLPANPLAVRIVQGGSRRLTHLWARMAYLGALIVAVLLGLLSGRGLTGNQSITDLAKAGTWVFAVISYGQIGLICLIAPLFMAGAIASEQSGKTFDIMLTTPLSNLQIVLGSLVGRLFFVLSLLASGLPLFAVLLIFGGVPIGSVFVSFGVAALSAILVGSVAITLAVLRAGGRKAVFLFVVTVITYLLAVYAADVFLLRANAGQAAPSWWAISADSTTYLTPLHPLLVLEASLHGAHYRVPPPELLAAYGPVRRFYIGHPFEVYTLLTGGASVLLVLWSAVRLRRVGQGRGWLGRLINGDGGERRRPPREVWANPIAWREARTRGGRAGGVIGRWAFVGVGLVIAVALLVLYHTGRLAVTDPSGRVIIESAVVFQRVLLILLWAELAAVVLVAIYMSAGSISKEREDGTLDLLLTTPITPRQYLWGKLRGLVSFLAPPLAVPIATLALVSLYTIVGTELGWPQAEQVAHVSTVGGQSAQLVDALIPFEAPVLWALVLVPFVAVCAMAGMTWSLKAKGVLGAVTPTVGMIAGVMLVLGLIGHTCAASVPLVGPFMNALSPTTSLLMFLDPWTQVRDFALGPASGRVVLAVSALAAAGVYSMIVYSLVTGLERSFDTTVRRLTGTV